MSPLHAYDCGLLYVQNAGAIHAATRSCHTARPVGLCLAGARQTACRLMPQLKMCRSALQHAHDGSVTGLSADACNKLLVSGGYDGALRIWSFKGRRLLHTVPVGRPIARLCHHASSALLSVATDDLLIRM